MRTLSFRDLKAGRKSSEPLLHADTRRDGLELGPGLHVIVAPNGYGKTTFLQTLAGVLPAISGDALLGSSPLSPREHVLYVSEYLTFPKFIYASEWIEFMAGGPVKSGDLARWIGGFRMQPLMERFLGRMSQGERRKLTWIGAHASGKPVLLLDEPLDGLDLLAIRCARELLAQWRAEGRIVLLVAHQVGELLDLAESLLVAREGRLLEWSRATGSPRPERAEELRKSSIGFYSADENASAVMGR